MNPSSELASRPAHILIVDDEPRNRQLLEVQLEADGYVLESVGTGEAALAAITKRLPDLVLLDVNLPGISGYEVATRLKSNLATKSIPIVMVTSEHDHKARMKGLTTGAEDYLTKPVERAELRQRISNLLRLKSYSDYHDSYSRTLESEVGVQRADLIESERLYRSTFDAAPVGIVHMGLDGQWLRVNQRLCDLLEYSREELQTAAVQDLVQSAQEVESVSSIVRMAAGTQDRHTFEERQYRRRDGTLLCTRVNISLYRDPAGQPQHFIVVIEDITAWRALEAQLRQSGKMDAIGRLASGVAHDFNNLLSIVLSYSEMLAADLKDGDPMRADLYEIRDAGVRGGDLTRQLLAFSRQQVLQPKIVDLREIIGGMEKMLRRLIGADIELSATYAPSLGKVLIDPGQLEQVIMNLVVNARDAMPRGGKLTIDTTSVVIDEAYAAQHAGVSPGPHVMLAVSDTGTGMDKATQARIFEPFFTTKQLGEGTGLGLATVFGIVRQSGGTIWVYSELGHGTAFKVYLPTSDETEIVRVATPAPDRRMLCGSETILLVDDEEPVRLAVGAVLRKYGYNVLDAQNGGEAFLMCEQHTATIHLLLTDVVMPRMSGRQLAERLVTLRPAMKVLYMSGYTDDAVVRHGILDSTVAFIQKPITPASLAYKVREILGSAGRATPS